MTAVNSLHTPAAPGVEPRIYEPSMEEILASIRRIIADDQSLPGRSAPKEAESAPAAEPNRLHDLAPSEAMVPASVHVIHAVETSAEMAPQVADIESPRPVAHGPIAAPQFASPEGTDSNDGLAPHAQHDQDAVAASSEREEMSAEPDIEPEPYAEPLIVPDSTHLHADEPEAWHESRHPSPEEPNPEHVPSATPLFSNATDHSVTTAFNTLAATRLADNSDELLGLAREMIRPLLKTWLDDNLPSMVERMVRAEIERVARGGR
jgi:cell pole-organizing protein PopZ